MYFLQFLKFLGVLKSCYEYNHVLTFWYFWAYCFFANMIVQISRKGPVTFESKILVKLGILFFFKVVGVKNQFIFSKRYWYSELFTRFNLLLFVNLTACYNQNLFIKCPILEDNNWWLLFQGFRFISFKQTTYFTSFLLTHQYSKTVYR